MDNKLKAAIIRFSGLQPVAAHFPIIFSNGAQLLAMGFFCNACKVQLPADDVHGTAIEQSNDVYLVSALGICKICKTYRPFDWYVRLREGQVSIEGSINGRQIVAKPFPFNGESNE